MIAPILSVLLKRSLRPFVFTPVRTHRRLDGVSNLGLYVHVPFCTTLCDFCPYFKVKYRRDLVHPFVNALVEEIRTSAAGTRRPVSNVYFGGGTPALLLPHLPTIQAAIDESFAVAGGRGIELHPHDINRSSMAGLRASGFNMVSIGVQSFQPHCLGALGRDQLDFADRIAIARDAGFSGIDVDLIFGIPGQTSADIGADFRRAVESGATQVSTYPFIDFTYASNRRKPLGRREKRRLLNAIREASRDLGYERTSVWTFARPGTERYSSVTRDTYLGFGPSAASLLKETFSINAFSVDEYVRSIQQGRSPTALSIQLTPRERELMWLFWHSYNLQIEPVPFAAQFGHRLEGPFGLELRTAQAFGILRRRNGTYSLTDRGAYLFHLVEQQYTNQYIDKVWRFSLQNPWPAALVIR